MFGEAALVAMIGLGNTDPVEAAIERFRSVETYQTTLQSRGGGTSETIRYFYMKPGFVRMEIDKPFKGTVLIYNPHTRRVYLWPFGHLKGPPFTFSPENRLVRSARGHRVDRSDLGALLENVRKLREPGRTDILGPAVVGERKTTRAAVTGNDRHTVETVHRYELWFDADTGLPVKVSSYGLDGRLIETVTMDGLLLDVPLPGQLFATDTGAER